MGAGKSVDLQVSFNRSNRFYFTGEQVSGNISINNTYEKLKCNEIFIELIGELGETQDKDKTKTHSNGESTELNHRPDHSIKFLIIRLPLAESDHVKSQMVLSRGHYTWPFEFTLPEFLPPSTEPNLTVYPYIRYFIRVVVDKPWYKLSQTEAFGFTVCPHVDLSHMNSAQQTLHFNKQNRRQLQLEGYLLSSGIIPGQSFSLEIKFQNPERIKIKRIEIAFIQHRSTVMNNHKEVIFVADLPGFHEFDGASLQETFEFPLPRGYIAPTYFFETFWHHQPYPFVIKYELILTIKYHGFFTNFEVSVPVIVGTESNYENQIQEEYDDQNTNQTVDELEPPPPSYESVVNTE
ncbi:unnamed protein product [Adineta steineri]|uniref:Arrestin-like N-terminal domain-containing protein n=1 Tax=Adineta steineri TaxID=433720 RepID=A0A814G6S4_9BILA|nr:unnamed protein product [Adineta steineri]CAF1267671.1 unnamed protein product [Adineta steineri]